MRGKPRLVCPGSYERVWLNEDFVLECPNCHRVLAPRNIRSGSAAEEKRHVDAMVPRHTPKAGTK
jgi:predicted HNH restriction endonuclease